MRRLKELLFWTLVLAYAAAMCGFGYELAQSVRYDHTVQLIRANDGTPCYTYRGQLQCDFYQRAYDTKSGEYPYATGDNSDSPVGGTP